MTAWPLHDPITTGGPDDPITWCRVCGHELDDSDARTPCPKGTPPMNDEEHDPRSVPAEDVDERPELAYERSRVAEATSKAEVSAHDMAEDNLSAIDQAAAELHAAIDRSPHEFPDGDELLAIETGKDVVRSTYDRIKSSLKARREERDRLNELIAELVEAETLWEPIVHRIENGPARRKPKTETTEPES